MNNTTTDIKFPTCGTTESNDAIEIKKPFLSEKASGVIHSIIYFIGVSIVFMMAAIASNYMWQNTSNKCFVQGYKQGYNQGYQNAKIELTKLDKTIDISKAYQYEFKK